MKEVNIIGVGYVGFTLALHMALNKVMVYATDKNNEIVDLLNSGVSHIRESSIQKSLDEAIQQKKITFSNDIQKDTGNWVIATSYFPDHQEQFLEVITSLFLNHKNEDITPLIMIRGTIPAGYIREYLVPGLEKHFNGKLDENFYLASTPERSLSGNAIEELSKLPQVVGGTELSVVKAKELFSHAGIEVITLPSYESSELVKSFTNYARLVQFNLANYLSVLADISEVSEQKLYDAIKYNYPRMDFLNSPGNGVGGFCLPKDSLVLHDSLKDNNRINTEYGAIVSFPEQQYRLNEEIIRYNGDSLAASLKKDTRILALGIAFKGEPETNDIRDSVGIKIINNIIGKGFKIDVFDLSINLEIIQNLGYDCFNADNLDNHDCILILNNNRKYAQFLIDIFGRTQGKNRKFVLYDPWRLIVEKDQPNLVIDYIFDVVKKEN